MSRAHSQFVRLSVDGARARYSLRTNDFGNTDEELAQIEINTKDNTFHVIPTEAWIRESIVPPHLYLLEDSVLRKHESVLEGYANGIYSVHILKLIREVRDRGNFPEELLRIT